MKSSFHEKDESMLTDEQSLPVLSGAKERNSGAEPLAEKRPAPEAFGAVYDRLLQPVYRYILSRVRNIQEAEDLTSQTFLTALEAFPRYRDRGRLAAWLFTIARNKIVDSIRRNSPYPLSEDDDGGLAVCDSEGSYDREFLLSVRIRISSLAEDEQELIRLRYVADLSFAEIAGLIGKREEAVKKSLYRLVARVRNDLEDRDE
jgi:RNA polymerase sigma-70 factor (ECF subfamily)